MSAFRYPKPKILAEIPHDRHAVIEASAGTGKTYTLEHLVVELLLETDTRLEQILLVTFTERATLELRARIRQKLAELLALDEHRCEPGVAHWSIGAVQRERLQAALTGLDSATIATIHGFCQRVLAEQAFDSGRLFDESQVDSQQAFHDAFLEVVRRDLATGPEQALLAAWLERTELEKIEGVLRSCASERGELRPGFDEAAFLAAVHALPCAAVARSLERELESVNKRSLDKIRRNLEPLLELHGGWTSRTDAAGILGELDAWAGTRDKPLTYLPEALGKAKSAALKQLGTAIARLAEVTAPFVAVAVHALLPKVRARLEARKRELGLFDFDDMLTLVRDAVTGPRGEALVASLRQRFRYALVDEFQDTDEIQWTIFRTLFHAEPAPPVLYLVGDPKQAIYGFRGADVQTYLAARDALKHRVPLAENFRSSEPLLGAVNRILDPHAPEPFFTGSVGYPEPVACGRRSLRLRAGPKPGDAEVEPVAVWQMVGAGKLLRPVLQSALAERICREIQALLDPSRPGLWIHEEGREPRRVEAHDIFVLTRKEGEGLAVGRVLRAAGVPVAFFKQEGLFQTAEARHVCDLLTAIAEPENGSARRRAWLTPFFGLTLDEVARAQEVEAWHPLLARILAWRALADARDYERLFSAILDESGIVRRELLLGPSERELTNYLHLFELLLEEVHRARGPLDELVRALDAFIRGTRSPPGQEGNLQRLESDGHAVQIMTMHKSKGLEAPVVFLAGGFGAMQARTLSVFHEGSRRCAWLGAVKGSPVESLVQQEQLEEDQRLMYVALTRAGCRLVLPYLGSLTDDQAASFEAEHRAPPAAANVDGAYAIVNDRLQALADAGELTGENGFRREVVLCRPAWQAEEVVAPLAAWTPPAELLAPDAPDPRVRPLREAHRGFFVTSYSRMSAAADRESREEENELFKVDRNEHWIELPPDVLPPGAATGVFLHEVLELLPLEATARATDLASWRELPEIARLIGGSARRHGVDDRYLPNVAQLTWNAVRTPMVLPGEVALKGIAAADRVLREVEFLYPIPERSHPRLAREPGAGAFSIERGCIKGFIDLVVEHRGRALFADWKSDLLPSYAPDALAAHVRESYAIQERLYTLAMVRMLGIRTREAYEAQYGGSLYLFLRGMGQGAGVHVDRPSWDEVVAWEEALVENREWGVAAS